MRTFAAFTLGVLVGTVSGLTLCGVAAWLAEGAK